MENASKALLMAGSILMALIVIGAVVFMFGQLSSIEQTRSDVEASTKLKDYSQRFEQFNQIIYGSELLSLSNLKLDYNLRQSEMKGYVPVTITVTTVKTVEYNKRYLEKSQQTIETIRRGIRELENDIEYYEDSQNGYQNRKERTKRSVQYYAQLSNRQIATLFEIGYTSAEVDYEIGERLADPLQNPRTSRLMKDIDTYKALKTVYTEFKNTRFTCTQTNYDANGTLISMSFVGINET